jgi:hypothetical protein
VEYIQCSESRLLLVAMTAAITTLAAGAEPAKAPEPAARPATAAANPFFKASTLQYQAPPFDKITDADFQPAIEEGMKQNIAEIEKIASQADAPTFANTIEAMERSGALLTRSAKVFFALVQANTNPTLQKAQANWRRSLPRIGTRSTSTPSCLRASTRSTTSATSSTPPTSFSPSATTATSSAPAPFCPMPTNPSCAR